MRVGGWPTHIPGGCQLFAPGLVRHSAFIALLLLFLGLKKGGFGLVLLLLSLLLSLLLHQDGAKWPCVTSSGMGHLVRGSGDASSAVMAVVVAVQRRWCA